MIELLLGAAPHDLSLNEARMLGEMLRVSGAEEGLVLGQAVSEAVDAGVPRLIRLGLDDIEALRAVLCRDNFAGFPGLRGPEVFAVSRRPELGWR
jgi:hypothetical protein